jgi:exopolyphosphatase/pppGpp-phosphohydrolase
MVWDPLLDTVETASGLEIKVIEPIEETRLLHQVIREAMQGTFDRPGKTLLVLALGSGSAEISAFREGRLILTETGRIGPFTDGDLASDASDRSSTRA